MNIGIVIPVYKVYDNLSELEIISLTQVVRVLGKHTFVLVHPKKMDVSGYSKKLSDNGICYKMIEFKSSYFNSRASYSRLLLSKAFYKKFLDFEFILIYQTDAFVFKDNLEEWCLENYSYVGAPWFFGFSPEENTDQLMAVGNGGFSLRKVQHFLKVMSTFSLINSWKYIVSSQMAKRDQSVLRSVMVIFRRLLLGNNTFGILNDFYKHNNENNSYQEDYFWGVICKQKFEWFKVPPPEKASQFSFEVNPEKLFILNGKKLPFGCHAWEKYQPQFWKPIIESYGYNIR